MKYKTMLVTIGIIVAALVMVHIFASRTLLFQEKVTIDQPIDEVWEVLGNQFTEPHVWATNFQTSKPGGEPKLAGLNYLHRATTTANGENWQELDVFDAANYRLVYHISKGVPPIAKRGVGEWKLTKLNAGQTQLQVNFILETKGLMGLVMSPVVGKKVSQASAGIVEEFAYYLDHGKPHPRKVAAVNQ